MNRFLVGIGLVGAMAQVGCAAEPVMQPAPIATQTGGFVGPVTGGVITPTGGVTMPPSGGTVVVTGGVIVTPTGGTVIPTGGTDVVPTGGMQETTGGAVATTGGVIEPPPGGNEPIIPEPSGSCPTFRTGTMEVGGLRGINVVAGTPNAGGAKAPMLIYWHGTGSSWGLEGRNVRQMQTDIVAQGGLVIAPDRSLGSGGDCSGTGTFSKDDFNVMDQIIACAVKEHNVDPRKIYTSGCSAGGLQAGCFASLRRQYIAAAVPNSGGVVFPQPLQQSEFTPAIMTMYGPAARDSVIIAFENSSKTLEDQFIGKGAFVISCNHGGGHCAAPGPLWTSAWDFMKAHPYGTAPSPYADGLPASYPSYCNIR